MHAFERWAILLCVYDITTAAQRSTHVLEAELGNLRWVFVVVGRVQGIIEVIASVISQKLFVGCSAGTMEFDTLLAIG
jgi:hypothetical protein